MSTSWLLFIIAFFTALLVLTIYFSNKLAIHNWWVTNYCRFVWGMPKRLAAFKQGVRNFLKHTNLTTAEETELLKNSFNN